MYHLKSITYLLLFCFIFQTCKAQKIATVLPKLENYDKGELEIKVQTFSSEKPISIGKIAADGTISFDFPELDLKAMNEMEDTYFFNMQKIGRAVGMFVCHDKEIIESTETADVVEVKHFFVYKYGQAVGALIPWAQKEKEKNKFTNGSNTFSWFYSSENGTFKAICKIYEDDDLGNGGLDKDNLRNQTSYNINFKKGWNIVETKLLKTKELEDDRGTYVTRSIEEKTSLAKMPNTIHWELEYHANDIYLEIEQQLPKLKPITPEQYKSWMPKKIGDLKLVNHEIGKKLERRESTDNINLIFQKASKKVDITILDCAGSEISAKDYTLILDMVSREWKDEKETGYNSASKMDDTSVMTEYNSEEKTTNLYFNSNERFSIVAKGIDVKPEELWEILKDLKLNNLK